MDKLFHSWNEAAHPKQPRITDDTLRDGLQAPNITMPTLEEKLRLIDCMGKNSVDCAILSYPAASRQFFEETAVMLRYVSERWKIMPSLAGRTAFSDLKPIADLQQYAGRQIKAYAFIGCSPIRQSVEHWDSCFICGCIKDSMRFLVAEGAYPSLVIEDSTRCGPEILKEIARCGVEHGAKSIVLADTVGHINPGGVRALLALVRGVIGPDISLEWHGHNDRGLALANALTAIACGADCIHANALGIGERTGNVALEQLLVNLWLDGCPGIDLSHLCEYAALTAQYTHTEIPPYLPVVGSDSFTTGTGVHAAAIVKALGEGNIALADSVYSSVPASLLGRAQDIEVGQMSGKGNVKAKLRVLGLPDSEENIQRILVAAKTSSRFLTDGEIKQIVSEGCT